MFAYDADGNLTADGSFTYDWDAENRLIGVAPNKDPNELTADDSKLEFAYDYMGRRVRKLVYAGDPNAVDWSATPELDRRFVYHNWLPLVEYEGAGNTKVRKYAWGLDLAGLAGQNPDREGGASLAAAGGIGGLLATRDVADSKSYIYFYDANGNVGQLVDRSDGSLDARYEYDAYGNNLLDLGDPNESGPYAAENPFRFSTKYFDDQTGLGYWGERFYAPRLGRWLSRDPAEEAGGENLYVFVRNDPANGTDAYGLWQVEDMHYGYETPPTGTYGMARQAGMNPDCAEIVAWWNSAVDWLTGSVLFPEFHFNYDAGGNWFGGPNDLLAPLGRCGRDCWYARRWAEGKKILAKACTWDEVKRGLQKVGQAMHSLQDKYSHQAGGQPCQHDTHWGRGKGMGHLAETPFDHAPSLVCGLLMGDPFGIIWPACKKARATNPNWEDHERPDRERNFPDDFRKAQDKTADHMEIIMKYRSMQCFCK